VQEEHRANYSPEINFILNKLWISGKEEKQEGVSVETFLSCFEPKKMELPDCPTHFKYRSTWFWRCLIYQLTYKV